VLIRLLRAGCRLLLRAIDEPPNVTSVASTLEALYWKECFKLSCSVLLWRRFSTLSGWMRCG
jgi:hypothetical protein